MVHPIEPLFRSPVALEDPGGARVKVGQGPQWPFGPGNVASGAQGNPVLRVIKAPLAT